MNGTTPLQELPVLPTRGAFAHPAAGPTAPSSAEDHVMGSPRERFSEKPPYRIYRGRQELVREDCHLDSPTQVVRSRLGPATFDVEDCFRHAICDINAVGLEHGDEFTERCKHFGAACYRGERPHK